MWFFDDDDVLPTESIFASGFHAARYGRFTTREIADRYRYTYHGADAMLNKAARVTPLAKDGRGAWIVTDDWERKAETIAALLPVLRRFVHQDAPPSDKERRLLLSALEHLLLKRHVP